jgi:hypothetical protein
MSTTLIVDPPVLRLAVAADGEGPIVGEIRSLLAAMYPQVREERRREQRFPYPRLVHLTPVAADGVTPVGETLVVAGKHLSQRGLGFYHPAPLAHRLAVVSLEKAPGEWLHVLLDVSWCRFRRQGWYESGGRFLRRVTWNECHSATPVRLATAV